LDVDILKLEDTLIREIEQNKEAFIFAEMLIGFAKKLNMKTIAIHIERESTKSLAEKLGIDYVQGFLIDKPSLLPTK